MWWRADVECVTKQMEGLRRELSEVRAAYDGCVREVKWGDLRYFGTKDELAIFLWEDGTNKKKDGLPRREGTCVDYSLELVEAAARAGFRMHPQTWPPDGVFYKGNHMLCMTFAGNRVYFIEPQNDLFWEGDTLR